MGSFVSFSLDPGLNQPKTIRLKKDNLEPDITRNKSPPTVHRFLPFEQNLLKASYYPYTQLIPGASIYQQF
ncbi:GSCFA domain-containing protein [Sesbania bispinosa]|nr:GSCFA domain-containing protein [Sesbania bispinosa]